MSRSPLWCSQSKAWGILRVTCTLLYLSISQEVHATGNLSTDTYQVSRAELQIWWLLVTESRRYCVHAIVATRRPQKSKKISVTHVLRYNIHWLCGWSWVGGRKMTTTWACVSSALLTFHGADSEKGNKVLVWSEASQQVHLIQQHLHLLVRSIIYTKHTKNYLTFPLLDKACTCSVCKRRSRPSTLLVPLVSLHVHWPLRALTDTSMGLLCSLIPSAMALYRMVYWLSHNTSDSFKFPRANCKVGVEAPEIILLKNSCGFEKINWGTIPKQCDHLWVV